jgi:asparagine synthase (glutamine-hydrolysing)
MCGIVGVIQPDSRDIRETASAMLVEIAHRGPDATGIWESQGVALANARLAIVDLSLTENQPMTIDGCTLVFNGEIYNYKDVRNQLVSLGRNFKTGSDTEVVLQAFLEWGLECFSFLNGMWAVAIYESKTGNLVLSRDRLGVKPLYWTRNNSTFGFSSEIKGLLKLVPIRNLNKSYFVNALLHTGVDSGAESPIEQIFQVEPGCHIVVAKDFSMKITKWWELKPPSKLLDAESAISAFKEVFEDAVRIRIPTDVSYGFSLSGGLDSTAVFCCAASHHFFGSKPSGIHNLSYIGGEMDESSIAANTCKQFDRELNIFYANPADLFEKVNQVVWFQEGIGWNPSILAYDFYYSKLRESGIKVILEGHGADEIFGGYPGMISEFLNQKSVFQNPRTTLNLLKLINASSNPEVGELPVSSNLKLWENYFRSRVSKHVPKFGSAARRRTRLFSDEIFQVKNSSKGHNPFSKNSFKSITYHHTMNQTLPQILRVFDRASMAHGVESRAPFLDYRLLELGMTLNDAQIVSPKYTKPIIRESLSAYLPAQVLESKQKRGFGAPIGKIINSPNARNFLKSSEMGNIFRNAEFIDSQNLKALLAVSERPLSKEEIAEIWQVTTFAIWQSKFL